MQPLRALSTGAPILSCPTTVVGIMALNATTADEILQALQIPSPTAALAKKETVLQAMLA